MYLLLKTVHIIAVVLFIGNITVGVFWKLYADASGEPRLMAHVLAGILRADRVITQPGAVLIVLSGFGLAMAGGYPILATTWIWGGLALFVLSAVIFKVWVEPVQRRLHAVASASGFDAPAYARLSRQWMVGGSLATLAPVAALVLMVVKPA